MFDNFKSKARSQQESENLREEIQSLKDKELRAREDKRIAEDELAKVKHDKKRWRVYTVK